MKETGAVGRYGFSTNPQSVRRFASSHSEVVCAHAPVVSPIIPNENVLVGAGLPLPNPLQEESLGVDSVLVRQLMGHYTWHKAGQRLAYLVMAWIGMYRQRVREVGCGLAIVEQFGHRV